ncbi:MAG: Dabb family protein [Cyclobacteriaceae bacterium]
MIRKSSIRIAMMLIVGVISFSYASKVLKKKPVLRHMVAFQFKDEVSEDRRAQAVQDFLDLKDKIPEIKKFEGGEEIGVEGYNKGLTHCFVLTFENEEARDVYLPHPAHIEVAKKNKPLLKDLLVLDFLGEK